MVTEYIAEELAKGRVVELTINEAESLGVHCSVIPKKSSPDKWRLILDLSSPDGHSVNDGIPKELASLKYISVDEVVARIVQLGRNTIMAKMDIKQAYRNIPIHPADCPLLGMRWDGRVYMDIALPFGLRSAPLIFTAVADALQWIMQQGGASYVKHYVDDFITLGAPGSEECEKNVRIMHRSCQETNMPVEPEKNEGPATSIKFLVDSGAMEIRLPHEKLRRLKALIASWRGRKVGTCCRS